MNRRRRAEILAASKDGREQAVRGAGAAVGFVGNDKIKGGRRRCLGRRDTIRRLVGGKDHGGLRAPPAEKILNRGDIGRDGYTQLACVGDGGIVAFVNDGFIRADDEVIERLRTISSPGDERLADEGQ